MIRLRSRPCSWLIVCLLLAGLNPTGYAGKPKLNKSAVLSKARTACYTIRNKGVLGYEADVHPDLRMLLESFPIDSARREGVIHMLEHIQFHCSFGSYAGFQVTHSGTLQEGPDALGIDTGKIFLGIHDMVTGFFQAWRPWVVDSIFAQPDSTLSVKVVGDHYTVRTSSYAGVAECVVQKDGRITATAVKSPGLKMVSTQSYITLDSLFLISGFTINVEKAQSSIKTTAVVSYTDVDGVKLPSETTWEFSYQGIPHKVKCGFSNYRIKR